LEDVQTARVSTGWNGLLGNKASVMLRCVLPHGATVCFVGSHFASGRGNVVHRNECYHMAVNHTPFRKQSQTPAPMQVKTPQPTSSEPEVGAGAGEAAAAAAAVGAAPPEAAENQEHAAKQQGEEEASATGGAAAEEKPKPRPRSFISTEHIRKAGADGLRSMLSSLDTAANKFEEFLFGEDLPPPQPPSRVSDSYSSPPFFSHTSPRKPSFFGILDHDVVIWAGDLNYALVDAIDDPAAARADFNAMVEPCDVPAKYIQAEQLTLARAQGHIFRSFQEGRLKFRPTYRVIIGEDAYDPKRCPAWTDRVLFRGIGVNLVDYSCVWEVKLSDHKPIYALFDVLLGSNGGGETSK